MKIYVEQDGKITPHESDVPVLHIGRATGNELVIDEPRSSRKHCRILSTPHGHFFEDLGSRNGTLLNGAKAEKSALSDGDVLEIGKTRIHFGTPPGESGSAGTPAAAATSDVAEAPTVSDEQLRQVTEEVRAGAATVVAGPDEGATTASTRDGEVEGVSLEALSGPLKGQTIEVEKVPFTIGRKADNDLILDDARASGHHARIVENDDGFYVEDLGSKNGTQVNSRPITEPTRLRRGVKLVIGEGKYRVRVPKRAASAGEAVEISRVNLEDFAQSQGNQVLVVLGLVVIVGAILFYAVDIGRRIGERRDLDPSPTENFVGREYWSFESELPEGASVPGWESSADEAQLSVVKGGGRGVRFPGLQALGVRAVASDSELVRATYYQDFNVSAGSTYFLSCHAYNSSAQAAGLVVDWMRDSDTALGSRSYTRAVLEQDEAEVASQVVVPAGARYARLSCFVLSAAGSGGQAVFDRIYFGEVAPAWLTSDVERSDEESGDGDRSSGALAQASIDLTVQRDTRRGTNVSLNVRVRPDGILADVHRGRSRVFDFLAPGLPIDRDPLRIGTQISSSVFYAKDHEGIRVSSRLPDVQDGVWEPIEINCRQLGSEIVARYVPRGDVGSRISSPSGVELFLGLSSTRIEWRAFDRDGMMSVNPDSASGIVELNLGRGKDLMAIRFEPAVRLRVVEDSRGAAGALLSLRASVERGGAGLGLQLSPVSMREDSDIANRIVQATTLYRAGKIARALEMLDQAQSHYKEDRLAALRKRWEDDAKELADDLGKSLDLYKRVRASLLRVELEDRARSFLSQYGRTAVASDAEEVLADLRGGDSSPASASNGPGDLLSRGRKYLNNNELELAEIYLREAQRVESGEDEQGEIAHLLNILEKRKRKIAEIGS